MFRCRDLLSLPTLSKAKLVAGEKGLDNGIRWSYKAENMNFAEWVHGQELLIVSTSVINSKDFDLFVLIKEAIRLKISGVLLLIGEDYISAISRQVLSFADQNKFPIIGLPGNLPLVDIFEELGHAIVYQEKTALNYEDVLSDIIFGNQIDVKRFVSQTELLGYIISGSQRIFMIHIELPEAIISNGFMGNAAAQLHNIFFSNDSEVLISHFHFNLVGLTGEASSDKLTELLESFIMSLKEKNDDIVCRVGIGSAYDDVSLLGKSFTEASTSLKLADSIQWYEHLGFLKVLVSIEDKRPMMDYMNQVLENVRKYDIENESDLLSTLVAYFDCNESMKEVAEKKYIHANTVKYRLKKVEEISGLSLSVSHEKIQLYNAILIMKILE